MEILLLVGVILCLLGAVANLVGWHPQHPQLGWIAIVVGLALVLVVLLFGPGGPVDKKVDAAPVVGVSLLQ